MTGREEQGSELTVALAQVAPVFLDRDRTLRKVEAWIRRASQAGAELVVFGEALVPGYPSWLCRTDGARFDEPEQKRWYSLYVEAAVDPGRDLGGVQKAAADSRIAVVLGVVERAADRGGKSLYCTCVTIGRDGNLLSAHRKLMPTYEERLVFGGGDGAGLLVHELGPFRLGALSCWENWMPLARSSLYAQGEDLHVALWPGSVANTRDLTRFVARESRSYVLSACGVLRPGDVPSSLPGRERFLAAGEPWLLNGGSAAAAPDGNWILEPRAESEDLFVLTLNLRRVLEERQNFDPSGHYARPDVFRLEVDQTRQTAARFRPGPGPG